MSRWEAHPRGWAFCFGSERVTGERLYTVGWVEAGFAAEPHHTTQTKTGGARRLDPPYGRQEERMPRVVLAMSGGVDSPASAVLLKRQGYDVVGLFMRTGTHGHDQPAADTRPENKKGCCSAIDAGDARRVADRLDIPFYALDFE